MDECPIRSLKPAHHYRPRLALNASLLACGDCGAWILPLHPIHPSRCVLYCIASHRILDLPCPWPVSAGKVGDDMSGRVRAD